MGFRLIVVKGAGEVVSDERITLGQALQLLVMMFAAHGRWPVQVNHFDSTSVQIRYPHFISMHGDAPLGQPDHSPGYTAGFLFFLSPVRSRCNTDQDQLLEMLKAYLFAYPDLGSPKIMATMSQFKRRLAA